MKRALAVIAKMVLGILVLIQKDETGDLLINGHISLAFVCLVLFAWAIIETILALFYEEDEPDELEEFVLDYSKIHPSARELTRSRDLDALFETRGGFGQLNTRHSDPR